MANEQELIRQSAEAYRKQLEIIQARRAEKPDDARGDKVADEAKRAKVEAENAELAEERAKLIRPTFKAPSDKLGVMAVDETSKVPWDPSKAPQGFRLIKGGARVVKDENGQPVLVVGKRAASAKGVPRNDCAHVFWCSAQWELGEARNMPVAKAYAKARDIVQGGGIAWVESRTLLSKGENPTSAKHVVMTDHKGMVLPTCQQGRLIRGRKTTDDASEIHWTVIYNDGLVLQIPRDMPTSDEAILSQAKDLLLNGSFQQKTPMVASWDGHTFTRTQLIKELPGVPMPEYKRPQHPVMRRNTPSGGKWQKVQQDRAMFSRG